MRDLSYRFVVTDETISTLIKKTVVFLQTVCILHKQVSIQLVRTKESYFENKTIIVAEDESSSSSSSFFSNQKDLLCAGNIETMQQLKCDATIVCFEKPNMRIPI